MLEKLKKKLVGKKWTNVYGKDCEIIDVAERGERTDITVRKGEGFEVHNNTNSPRPKRVG